MTTKTSPFSLPQLLQNAMKLWYLILFVILPLVFLTNTSELFELNKMILVFFVAILILATWGARMVVEKKVLWKRSPFDIPLALFLIAQILSTLFSIHPHTSLFGYYSRWHGGLLSSLAYLVILYGFVNSFSKKDIKQFLSAIMIGGVLASLYAIPEHFGVSPSCVLIEVQDHFESGKSLASTFSEMSTDPGKFFTTGCWSERTNPKYRIFGTFGQPNWLAAYVILLVPLSMLLSIDNGYISKRNLFSKIQIPNSKFQKFFSTSQITNTSVSKKTVLNPQHPVPRTQNPKPTLHTPHSTFSKILTTLTSFTFYLLPFTLFPTLLFTSSRSGFLGFIVSMGVLVSGFIFIHRQQKKNYFQKLYILYLISYILFALLFGTPFTPSAKQVFAPKLAPQPTQQYKDPGDLGGTDSGDIRKIVWTGAIKVWQRYPIFGSGLETFGYSYYQDRPIEHNQVSEWEYLYNKAHNEFLNYLATTGTVGLSAYLLWQAWTSIMLLRIGINEKNSPFSRLFSVATLASLSALHVSNFFGFSTVTVSVLFYLLPGMVWLTTQDDKLQRASKESLHAWQQFTLVGIGILTIIPLVQVFALWQADYLYARSQKELRNANYGQAEELAQHAITLFPSEGAYYGQLGKAESEFAVALANQEEYALGGEKATQALDAANQMLLLNPYHLSFYRTRVTILLTLAAAQPALYDEALKTVVAAETLAPTDPKLPYTEGLIEQQLEATPEAIRAMQKAVDLKSDYEGARWQLGQLFELNGEIEKAIEQYQYMIDHIPTGNTPTVKQRLDLLEASQSGSKTEN